MEKDIKEITVIEAYDLISSQGNLQLIDIREAAEFKNDSIDGFTNIPLSELSHHMPELEARKKILLIDAEGHQSQQAQTMLEACGYEPIVIRGGIRDWKKIVA